MRWLLTILLVIVLAAVIGAVIVAQRLDSMVVDAVERYGYEYAGVAVTLDSAQLSPFSGRGELRGLTVDNPDGYEGDAAVRVGRIAIALRPRSLLDDPVVIDVIDIEGAEVHAISRDLRDTNLQVILRNIQDATPPADPEAAPGRQLIIERLGMTDTRASVTAAHLGAVDVRVPDITLTEVGRRTGGASIGEVLRQILEPVVAAVITSVSEGRVRDLIDERGGELREGVEEEADRLRDRLRDLSPF